MPVALSGPNLQIFTTPHNPPPPPTLDHESRKILIDIKENPSYCGKIPSFPAPAKQTPFP